ncbi:hypothetical protein PQQ59_17500 [Paraburkholderia aspalathi]|uniref:terminase small subunit-like protein n=1 Tax=Paraburkholderia aspalathi TaxID=1324617 RepID=UPI0038B7437D
MAVKIGGKVLGAKPEAPKNEPAKAKKSPRGKRITNKAYPLAVYEKLFQYVANGETLADACKRPGMPSAWTVRRRLAVDDILADQYRKAEGIKYRAMVEDLPYAGQRALEGQEKVSNADRLAAAKLDSDNKKWIAQRILSEYAGEGGGGNVVLHITGAADIPPVSQPASTPAVPLLKIVNSPKPVGGGDDA